MPVPALSAAVAFSLLALFTLISGLDDLVLLFVWLARGRSSPEEPDENAIRAIPEKRIALFIPLWHEHQVIERMLEHNLAAIRYRNFEIFVGTYPNDPATQEAVRVAARRFGNVHLAVCPSDGPTSKGDCLNWVYQQMLIAEEECGSRFDAVVTHDAEDLVHPDALHWINYHLDRVDMVQIPVLPLPTPPWRLTHGVYCDEFAEFQTKDILARQALGSFIPSNGVGTGYSRRSLQRLAETASNRVFEPGCLTEDYENGLRLHRIGFRQYFVPVRFAAGQPVATREYFPQNFRHAIRQRTRWILGIALQSWERNGWRGNPAVLYWFWRDRKGLVGNPVSVAANAAFVCGAAAWIWNGLPGAGPAAASLDLPPRLMPVLYVTLALQFCQMLFRLFAVARIYGWSFAAAVPIRALWGNLLNAVATCMAVWRYGRARWHGLPLGWSKTEHNYPSREALSVHKRRLGEILTGSGYLVPADLESALASQPAGVRLGEHLVEAGLLSPSELYEALSLQQNLPVHDLVLRPPDRRAVRSLPARLMARWRCIPVEISDGRLVLAGPELPTEEVEHSIRRHTNLEVHCRLITPDDYERLRGELVRDLDRR